jgi:hypothetical protein
MGGSITQRSTMGWQAGVRFFIFVLSGHSINKKMDSAKIEFGFEYLHDKGPRGR